jgi:hypothetical protein
MTDLCTDPSVTTEAFSSDILEGAAAIAAHTGKTLRQAHYLLETGQLPAFKIGKVWHMRRSTFQRHIEQLEAAAQVATSHQ